MKIVLVKQDNKTFKMSPNGYMDTVDPYLKFGVVIEEGMTMDEIYNAFNTGDTSSIRFNYDNGQQAWIKNSYNTLTSFKVETNCPLGHNPDTDTDTYADVAWIEMTKDDTSTRLASAESTIAAQNATIEALQKQISSMSSQLSTLSSKADTISADVEELKNAVESSNSNTGASDTTEDEVVDGTV